MMMPGRSYNIANYRYGFNGKENDNEVKGDGSLQDYGMRIYDPRLGKFLSIDPISDKFPWNSVYLYAEGDPVNYQDLDGLEKPLVRAQAQEDPLYPKLLYPKGPPTQPQPIQTSKPLTLEEMRKWKDNNNRWFLDMTPIGDLKVLVTGENFKHEKQSRISAAVFILPWSKLGIAGKFFKTASKAQGIGKEAFEQVAKKVDNISAALDEVHVKAAVNDILGKPVVINGKAYDHLTEVKNALSGLSNQISKLDELIKADKTSNDVIKAATQMRSQLQKQKDAISDVLNRAEAKTKL